MERIFIFIYCDGYKASDLTHKVTHKLPIPAKNDAEAFEKFYKLINHPIFLKEVKEAVKVQ